MEKEIKEIKIEIPEGYEIDKENSTFECIRLKPIAIKTWKDIQFIRGYYIDIHSKITPLNSSLRSGIDQNIYLEVRHAKSALAMAQISQLMPYYGGEITLEEWEKSEGKDIKYVIRRFGNDITKDVAYSDYQFLAFKDLDNRDKFLDNNLQLVKDYLMIG